MQVEGKSYRTKRFDSENEANKAVKELRKKHMPYSTT